MEFKTPLPASDSLFLLAAGGILAAVLGTGILMERYGPRR